MAVASPGEYYSSIKNLFPRGEYWDRQFADPKSDVSLFCKAKLPELIKFRERMETLQKESFTESTEELIAEWERVLLNSFYPHLSLIQRRLQLSLMWHAHLNRPALQKIASMFDLTIVDVFFPYKSGFFGFSRCGNSYIGSPYVFSVFKIRVQQKNFRRKSWEIIKQDYPAKSFGRMRAGIDRLVYFPAYQMRLEIYMRLRKSAAGFARCGRNRLFPLFTGFDAKEFLQNIHFFYRFENALIKRMLGDKRPFEEFEQAIKSILFFNHIPYFAYEEGRT